MINKRPVNVTDIKRPKFDTSIGAKMVDIKPQFDLQPLMKINEDGKLVDYECKRFKYGQKKLPSGLKHDLKDYVAEPHKVESYEEQERAIKHQLLKYANVEDQPLAMACTSATAIKFSRESVFNKIEDQMILLQRLDWKTMIERGMSVAKDWSKKHS